MYKVDNKQHDANYNNPADYYSELACFRNYYKKSF